MADPRQPSPPVALPVLRQHTILLSVPDAGRRAELATMLTGASFRVLESDSWTQALEQVGRQTVDIGVVDASISDYYTDPPPRAPFTSPGGPERGGEIPLIFLVEDPDCFDWDAYAQLDRAEILSADAIATQLVPRICALARRLERQAMERENEVRLRTAVRQVSAAIRGSNNPVEIVERLVDGLQDVLDVDLISFGTYADDRVPELALQWRRTPGDLRPVDTTQHRRALRDLSDRLWDRSTTLPLNDHRGHTPPPGVEELFAWAMEIGARASVSVPVGDGDTAFGLLWLGCFEPRRWSSLELLLLQRLAGNVAHAMMQGQVITGQQEVLRRLERLDRAKSDFLATVNHELRTPLTSLTAYLDLVQDGAGGPVPPRAAEMLGVVDRNARRLGALIDDVLTISRMAADDTEVDWAPVDLTALADQVVAKLRRTASEHGVEVVATVPRQLVLDGDAAQLKQVLTQLADNAVKFTGSGGRVGVEITELVDGDEEVVEIAVTDTGIGIPEGELSELFTRFFRGSNATAAAAAGSGLGLTIVNGLVEAHEGRIFVEPTPGGGTRIRVRLPRTHRVDQPGGDRCWRPAARTG